MATILVSLVGSCAKKLEDIITEKAILILGVKEELRGLQQTIEQIQCFLNDAEQRRSEEQSVNNWLAMLRDAMYDADDIIDMARFEGSKLLGDRPSSSRNTTACNGISALSCFSNIKKRHVIAIKIRNINSRIEKISKLGASFLTRSDATRVGQSSAPKIIKRGHLVEPNLVGKEITYSCQKLVDLVLTHKEKKNYKIAIVGTGGVGKTTLASKIYHDQRINGSFKKHVWICVSKEYNHVSLLKEILRNMGVHQEQGESIAELENKLAETIEGSSFFLVLDDVWHSNVWTDLLRVPLNAASAGVIFITTRDDTTAMKIGVDHTHRVDLMSVHVGWELLWRSMNIREENQLQNLKNLGIEIVRKCGCLPLAIKVTASALAEKDPTEHEWKKFLRKSAWSHSKLPKEIESALYLSYDELPHHLKQCFLYCSMYPEDYEMDRNDLVRLWVAEGFIEQQKGQFLEDTAEDYYYDLIHRNFLQPDGSTFDQQCCKMHDLLRQLACYLSREECFVGNPESLEGKTISKLRRVTVVTNDWSMLPSANKEIKIRTILCKGEIQTFEDSFFMRFPYLRVLDLTGSPLCNIASCIGSLVHLRLLDLDATGISYLPESIGCLINLQILNLQRCKALTSLPLAITKLYNLRRLGLDETPIQQVPKGIGKLKFLNDLEGFPVGDGSGHSNTQEGWKLEELSDLMQLRCLDVNKLERAAPSSTDSFLVDKEHLRVLCLWCSKDRAEPYPKHDVYNIEMVFEQLIPPHGLEDLSISGFFGRGYPSWLGSTHLPALKYLIFIDCNSCEKLPSIEHLPNLKYLRIDGAPAVIKIGAEFVGYSVGNLSTTEVVAFPMLESLIIFNMPNLEEWSFVEEEGEVTKEGGESKAIVDQTVEALTLRQRLVFPRLRHISINNCPKLRALPQQLGQEVTCLRELFLYGATSLKVVEDMLFLSYLVIEDCDSLERVKNLPGVRELSVRYCPNLRHVEGLDSLQQLWLDDGMWEISSLWVPGLQEQHRQLHGEDIDVYAWKL